MEKRKEGESQVKWVPTVMKRRAGDRASQGQLTTSRKEDSTQSDTVLEESSANSRKQDAEEDLNRVAENKRGKQQGGNGRRNCIKNR